MPCKCQKNNLNDATGEENPNISPMQGKQYCMTSKEAIWDAASRLIGLAVVGTVGYHYGKKKKSNKRSKK